MVLCLINSKGRIMRENVIFCWQKIEICGLKERTVSVGHKIFFVSVNFCGWFHLPFHHEFTFYYYSPFKTIQVLVTSCTEEGELFDKKLVVVVLWLLCLFLWCILCTGQGVKMFYDDDKFAFQRQPETTLAMPRALTCKKCVSFSIEQQLTSCLGQIILKFQWNTTPTPINNIFSIKFEQAGQQTGVQNQALPFFRPFFFHQ